MTEEMPANAHSLGATEDIASKRLVAELEARVRVAQLRAQELEAEILLMTLMEKRRELKSGKRSNAKDSKEKRNRRRARKSQGGNAAEARKLPEQ